MVDTGADFCLVPREVAEVLGVDVEELPGPALPFGGATGGGLAKEMRLKMELLSRRSPLKLDLPFVVTLKSAPGQSKDVLIGRQPLFHDYDFGFRMGFTDDPDLGKFTMHSVRKRHGSSHARKSGPLLTPSGPG
ncbi:MAG: retropepsin-like aspartic protease [Candidatus Lutacidiplasmatales archaeon]